MHGSRLLKVDENLKFKFQEQINEERLATLKLEQKKIKAKIEMMKLKSLRLRAQLDQDKIDHSHILFD